MSYADGLKVVQWLQALPGHLALLANWCRNHLPARRRVAIRIECSPVTRPGYSSLYKVTLKRTFIVFKLSNYLGIV